MDRASGAHWRHPAVHYRNVLPYNLNTVNRLPALNSLDSSRSSIRRRPPSSLVDSMDTTYTDSEDEAFFDLAYAENQDNNNELASSGNLDVDIQVGSNEYFLNQMNVEMERLADTDEEVGEDAEDDDYFANDDDSIDEYFSHLFGELETLRSDNPSNERLLLSSSSQNYTRRNAIISSNRRHNPERHSENSATDDLQETAVPLRRQYTIRGRQRLADRARKNVKTLDEAVQIGAKIQQIVSSLQNLPYKARLSPIFPVLDPCDVRTSLFRISLMQQDYLTKAMDNVLKMRRNGSWCKYHQQDIRNRKRKSNIQLADARASGNSFGDVRLLYHDQSVHIQLPPPKRKRTADDFRTGASAGSISQASRNSKIKGSILGQDQEQCPQNGTLSMPLALFGNVQDRTFSNLEKESLHTQQPDVSSFYGEQCTDDMFSSEDKETILNIIPNSHLINGSTFSVGKQGSKFVDLNIQIVDYDKKTMEGTFQIHLNSIQKLIQVRQFFLGDASSDSLAARLLIFDKMTTVIKRMLYIDNGIDYTISLPFHGNLVDFKKNDLRFFVERGLEKSRDNRLRNDYSSCTMCLSLNLQLLEWMKLNPFKQFQETYFLLLMWHLKSELVNCKKASHRGSPLSIERVLPFARDLIKYIEPITKNLGFAKHQTKDKKIAFFDESRQALSARASSNDRETSNSNAQQFDAELLSVLNATEVYMRGRNTRHAFILRDPPPRINVARSIVRNEEQDFVDRWKRMMADSLGKMLTSHNNSLVNLQWNYILCNLTVDAGDLLDHLLRIVVASSPESIIQNLRGEDIESLNKDAEVYRITLVSSIDRKSGRLELANTVNLKSRMPQDIVPECPLPRSLISPPVHRLSLDSDFVIGGDENEDGYAYSGDTVLTGYKKCDGFGGGMPIFGVL